MPARSGEPLRVCLIGPESSGKSTLCDRLAAHFHAPCVGEYGRDYTLAKLETAEPDVWRADEFVHIACEQQRREDAAAERSDGLLFCDTDAFATEIWLERYLGLQTVTGWPQREHPIDLYLLTDQNVPFVGDAIRDGEHLRAWMFDRFRTELTARDLPYVVLRGDYEERERIALQAVSELLAGTAKGA
ncbi:MAG: ATP-binding protein [Candidatus Eremiobacteraeota bacterium]|nr:ATP-binding protein [Candidatus Eremiobacteraeota bacterium]